METKKLAIPIIILILMVVVSVLTVNCASKHNNAEKTKINYVEYVQLKNAELKYWAIKAELVEAVDNYIHTAAPNSNLSGAILVDECEKYKVDIKLALAQGHLESHFGTQGLGAKTNSVWNVGAFSGLTLSEINKKHIFDNPNQSIVPYLELLTTKYLTDTKTEENLLENFVSVDGYHYAGSPTYEVILRHKYETIATSTKIDSLQDVLRYWIVQSNREY